MKEDRLRFQRDAVEKIKILNAWEPGRKFTRSEFKDITGHTGNTFNALLNKGIVKIVENTPFEEYDLYYYVWTGKGVK